MKAKLKEWAKADRFNLDWLLRSVNTALTGEAKFTYLHDKGTAEIQDGLKRAIKHIDSSLNLIAGRLGLDHDRVLFSRFAIPVMVRYRRPAFWPHERKRKETTALLVPAVRHVGTVLRLHGVIPRPGSGCTGGQRRWSGQATGTAETLAWWAPGRARPLHWLEPGARFYPVLYLLTRMGESRDWGSGLALKANLLGKMSRLEVHHIFPKAQLYKKDYRRPEVNALANFCFLTKDTNLDISDRCPEEYFLEVQENHPGALESQ